MLLASAREPSEAQSRRGGDQCPDTDLSGLVTRHERRFVGQFFADRKPKTANKVACDIDLTARLWRLSAELVGMTPATS